MEGDDDDVSGADIDTGTIPEGGWFEDGGTLGQKSTRILAVEEPRHTTSALSVEGRRVESEQFSDIQIAPEPSQPS